MTDAEQKEAARQFIIRWNGKGDEKQDSQSFWIDLLENVLGMENTTERVQFEKPVIVDGHTKYIDAYIPETKVLIEQKSHNKSLDQKIKNSGDVLLSPYDQAKRYNNHLNQSESARWIVTSNFSEIWIYNMDQINSKDFKPTKIFLSELQLKAKRLGFLIEKEIEDVPDDVKVSKSAGDIVGDFYNAFQKQYKNPNSKESLRSLNALCVRIVFCLYAEDAGIFGKADLFEKYMRQFSVQKSRKALEDLFEILDMSQDERDNKYPYLADDDPILASFPYVNGGLFADETIEIPPFTDEIQDLILKQSSEKFDWSLISPTIFGAVFESTLNPETRRKGGMHYTSIENIHKVIDPLFLDSLKAEFEEIKQTKIWKTKEKKLKNFQNKLASLVFLDPACGSGNFLTESYISLRRLENKVIAELKGNQIVMGEGDLNPIKVSITQFHGIEINDFAVSVAKTALWIAESQMMDETQAIVNNQNLDFLPLTTNANIVEGNSLQIDWNDVVPIDELNYIMGNPPFVGSSMMTKEQKNEVVSIVGKIHLSNSLDYVAGWYYKAATIIQNTIIKAAFVSTNSITQGEQVEPLWNQLLHKYNIKIDFAYRTFQWDSEASLKAHVHCVIIGFSSSGCITETKKIFENDSTIIASNINPYLMDAPNILIKSRSKPICDVQKMTLGNKPTDHGNFILSEKEKDKLLSDDPSIKCCIRRYIGAKDYLNNNEIRYCLWLKDVSPSIYIHNKEIMRRIKAVKEFREKSSAAPTRKSAQTAYRFFSAPQTDEPFLIIPGVSSERRKYIPIGFMPKGYIASNACSIICGADLYSFGVLESNVHMAWLKTVGGRLEMRYRYSGNVVYNNFPWPSPTKKQKALIEKTAQNILDVRAKYPECSLADLYNPDASWPDLLKAHQMNDKAVMMAYNFDIDAMSEADCVAELMKMYQDLTENEKK